MAEPGRLDVRHEVGAGGGELAAQLHGDDVVLVAMEEQHRDAQLAGAREVVDRVEVDARAPAGERPQRPRQSGRQHALADPQVDRSRQLEHRGVEDQRRDVLGERRSLDEAERDAAAHAVRRHDHVSRALVQGVLDGGLQVRPFRRPVVVAVAVDRGRCGVVAVLDREHGHAELHGGGEHPQPLAGL